MPATETRKPALTATDLRYLRTIDAAGGHAYLSSRWAEQLSNKGLVTTRDWHVVAEPSKRSGGRSQALCIITTEGRAALAAALLVNVLA